jgi:diaminopimelate epimerase
VIARKRVYHLRVEPFDAELYDACGNALLLVQLSKPLAFDDGELRGKLRRLGLLNQADSVMVLTGDPSRHEIQGYHVSMDVFEPRGIDSSGLPGSWSTMCGNGIGAVASFLASRCPGVKRFRARTRSGDVLVSCLSDGRFSASMGRFTMHPEDLAPYVRDRDFGWIRAVAERRFRAGRILAGLSGYRAGSGRIDGEPQLVVFVDDGAKDLSELVKLAGELGPFVGSDKRVFPLGVNVNLVAPHPGRHDQVLACTFERGVDYVTGSSGTGATAVGASFLSAAEGLSEVEVCMPGGVLGISRDGDEYRLQGHARHVSGV